MEVLKKLYVKWSLMKPISFIFATIVLSFILAIPILILIIYLDLSDEEIGIIDPTEYSVWYLFLAAVVLAPLIETLLFQSIPIKLIQKVLGKKINVIALCASAILFSLAHFGYSIWYCIMILPMGVLLAASYIIFQKRKESSFWITAAVHSIRNLISVIILLL